MKGIHREGRNFQTRRHHHSHEAEAPIERTWKEENTSHYIESLRDMDDDDFSELLADLKLEKELEDAFRIAIGEWTPKTLRGFLKAVRCEAKLDVVEKSLSGASQLAGRYYVFLLRRG